MHGEIDAAHAGKRDLKIADHVGEAPVCAHQGGEVQRDIVVSLVAPGEFVQLRAFLCKRAHHAHARQVFLQRGGKRALGFIRACELPLHAAEIEEAEHHKNGQQAGGYGRHRAADGQHDGNGRANHHHGAHHLHGLHLHKAANRLHVAGAALDKVTRLHAHMIAVWHGLQMREQPVAQALGQSLARKGDAVAAQIGEYAAQQRHQNHKRGQHPDVAREIRPPAHALEQSGQSGGQLRRFVADDAVHREGNDERRDVGEKRGAQRRRHAQDKIPLHAVKNVAQQPSPEAAGPGMGLFGLHDYSFGVPRSAAHGAREGESAGAGAQPHARWIMRSGARKVTALRAHLYKQAGKRHAFTALLHRVWCKRPPDSASGCCICDTICNKVI